MEMFTNNNGKWKIENGKLFITMTFFVLCLVALKCYAFANFYLVATNDKDLQAKLEFLDKHRDVNQLDEKLYMVREINELSFDEINNRISVNP